MKGSNLDRDRFKELAEDKEHIIEHTRDVCVTTGWCWAIVQATPTIMVTELRKMVYNQ